VITRCPGVRTLNFESEKTKNWRQKVKINDFPVVSVSLWNSTVAASSGIKTPFNTTFFDYWTKPSMQTDLVATLSAYSDKAVKRDDVSIEVCGAGWNCSYVIEFTAPGYRCEQLAKGRGDNTAKLAEMNAPFNTKDLLPDGKYGYVAHTTLGDYSLIQVDTEPGGVPKNMTPPWPKNLGAFRTEPVLWIGHSDLADPGQPIPAKDDSRWLSAFVPTIFRCEHYYTQYQVQFNHTLSDQSIKVLNRTYLRPVVDTVFVRGKDANDGTKDNVTAIPEKNYVLPIDTENYRLTAAYHSLGSQLRYFINGSITFETSTSAIGNTEALKTKLINKLNYLVVPNFQERIQEFYENIVFSLFGNPQFLVLTWAAAPTERAGKADAKTVNDPRLLHPCTKTRTAGAYLYNARDLWLVYSFAIISAVAGVFFGALALIENNNHVRDTRVSSIMAASRAPALEDLPWSKSQWGEVPPEIREVKMGYGMVYEDQAGDDPLQQKSMYGFAPVEVLDGRTGTSLGSSLKSPLNSMVSRLKGRMGR